MRLKIGILTLLSGFLMIVSCHHDPPVGPKDDGIIHGRVTVVVLDPEYNAVSNAEVRFGDPGSFGGAYEYTNPGGSTRELYYDLDSTKYIYVEVKKPGYVIVIDSFTLTRQQPQFHITILPHDSGFIQGSVIFNVQDTAGNPLKDASIDLIWFPSRSWSEPFYGLAFTQANGKTPIQDILIDSLRNQLIFMISESYFKEVTDTISIIADSTQEVIYKLQSS
ncbi:exported hypothetical protein [Candidatus Zixiibacteriota bacterium]|nr:exported hypothetical protein [candidate division Zixibacteria bacterium]